MFLEFFLKPVFRTMVAKSFKFMMLRLLENVFVIQKINLFIFTHVPKQKSPLGSYHYQAEEITHFPQKRFLYFFLSRKERGFWSCKNDQN